MTISSHNYYNCWFTLVSNNVMLLPWTSRPKYVTIKIKIKFSRFRAIILTDTFLSNLPYKIPLCKYESSESIHTQLSLVALNCNMNIHTSSRLWKRWNARKFIPALYVRRICDMKAIMITTLILIRIGQNHYYVLDQ